MPLVVIDMATLASRGEAIRLLLRPLVRNPSAPAWQRVGAGGPFIIGTHDGSPSTSEYRDWRFDTFVHGFRAMYFELWQPTDEKKYLWYLDKSYLSIFKRDSGTDDGEREFLCLHCDPNEPEDADHVLYKRGPHLHIVAADAPFPHAHLALSGGQLDNVLLSVENLSEAIKLAIEMLRDEVMNALVEH